MAGQVIGMIAWLQRNRTSVRLAFLLRLFTMVIGVFLSLLWSRLLLRAMGDSLNGLYIAFQAVARLGGLGDLGMGGAVALRAGQMLGPGDESRLRHFLANARAAFLMLAAASFFVLVVLSPWLPGWLHFKPVIGGGSLTCLFIVGAFSAGLLIINSYFQNLNYACGTVTWPILPSVIFTQLAFLGHWFLAKSHSPLWVQYIPYVAVLALSIMLAKQMLGWSHGWVGSLAPLGRDRAEWKWLLASSGWVYLCSLGNLVYTTTDRLVINGRFGSEILPTYFYNYKVCELAVGVVLSAGFVSIPKITQWLASNEPSDQQRARTEILRLNQFQVLLGCAAALVYLAINDLFVRWWLGPDYHAPLAWQAAFACNLAVTTGGDAGIQITGRCGHNGLRVAGLTIGAAGLLNLLLAIVAAKMGSITGIAAATVVAQTFLSLALGLHVCRYLKLPVAQWAARSWFVPFVAILAAVGLKLLLPAPSFRDIGWLSAGYSLLLVAVAFSIGINRKMLEAEGKQLRSMLKI